MRTDEGQRRKWALPDDSGGPRQKAVVHDFLPVFGSGFIGADLCPIGPTVIDQVDITFRVPSTRLRHDNLV